MGKSRRSRRPSNRRLPNFSRSSDTPTPGRSLINLIRLSDMTPLIEAYQPLRRRQSQLAPNINKAPRGRSKMLKTFDGSTLTSKKNVKNGKAGPSQGTQGQQSLATATLKVCTDRSERKEVLFATKKTGLGGQKTPIHNWKSKVRCK